MSQATPMDVSVIQRLQRWALIAGAAGMTLCIVGAAWDSVQFFRSYLFAAFAWLSIGLGSLAIVMLHNLTGGTWGVVIRRFLEAAMRTLPLMLLLFAPLAFGLDAIYPWARSEPPPMSPGKEIYLDAPFFLIRAGAYFAIWLLIEFLLNRWSEAQDRTPEPGPTLQAQQFSGPGLILYGLSVTFAAADWVMSLEPHWYSTIFGAVVATGQMLPALALGIAAASWFSSHPPLAELATPPVWNDLGNLLLAFVMLWTYIAFSQFLVIWSGNLPEEIVWYVHRSEGGWQAIGVALAVFYFALPFVLLLSRDIKRNPRHLRVIALAVVGMSFVHHFWLIFPAFSPGQFSLHWMDLAALVGVGGLWLAQFLRSLCRRPLIPIHDPNLVEALHHA
jgi:hypothetical protein